MPAKNHPWKGFLPDDAVVMTRKPRHAPGLTTQPGAPEGTPKTGDSLEQVAADLLRERPSKLAQSGVKIVLGEGNPHAGLVFVGEAPGEQEDIQGRPFVGKAGQLLDKMIEAMGLHRDQVYITNAVKCRPPGNRTPEPDEVAAFHPYLMRELDLIQPRVIVALGKVAAQALLQAEVRITQIRGRFQEFRGVKLMPTFHPAYLLRNPEAKSDAWADLKQVAKELGIEIPGRKK